MDISIENTLLLLKLKLSKFGLNPNDWDLYLFSQSNVLIKNKKSPDFLLKGRLKSTDPMDWDTISLFAI